MKRVLSLIIAALIIVIISSVLSVETSFAEEAAAQKPDGGISTFEQGTRESFGDVQLVDLHGTWREMGRQYGALMKNELDDVYAFVQLMLTA